MEKSISVCKATETDNVSIPAATRSICNGQAALLVDLVSFVLFFTATVHLEAANPRVGPKVIEMISEATKACALSLLCLTPKMHMRRLCEQLVEAVRLRTMQDTMGIELVNSNIPFLYHECH